MHDSKFVFHNFYIALSGSHSHALLYEKSCSVWQHVRKYCLFSQNGFDFFFGGYFSIAIIATMSKPSNED